MKKKIKNEINPKTSFIKKYGKNDILSEVAAIPNGLLDPSK
jgi:hypothetical protein